MGGRAATVAALLDELIVIRGNEAARAQSGDFLVNLVRSGYAELARPPDELADLWRRELIETVTRRLEEVML